MIQRKAISSAFPERELLKKAGEACGQTVEKDCGQCGHDLYCSNINSPIRPKQCGKCLPKWTWKNANTGKV